MGFGANHVSAPAASFGGLPLVSFLSDNVGRTDMRPSSAPSPNAFVVVETYATCSSSIIVVSVDRIKNRTAQHHKLTNRLLAISDHEEENLVASVPVATALLPVSSSSALVSALPGEVVKSKEETDRFCNSMPTWYNILGF